MKIVIILGTRPEIIKMSPIIRELMRRKIDFFILHTNQHFYHKMDTIFFEELQLPKPKYNLNIRQKTHGKMTGEMIIKIEDVLLKEKPDWALVEGDTNTVLAGAITASKLGIKLAHVEAGLRSYDRSMPEELNRIVADHLSDALFAPTENQKKILRGEGISEKKIFVTGNTIVDAVYQNLKIAYEKFSQNQYQDKKYFLLTLHRPSNVDDKKTLQKIISILENVVDRFGYPIYFPVHPRTQEKLLRFNIKLEQKKIKSMDPVGYLEMLLMEKNARLILTDSGGIQEEACILKVPCVTLRNNTERPETVKVGANTVAGLTEKGILTAIKKMFHKKTNWSNPFGDGKSGKKIIQIISQ